MATLRLSARTRPPMGDTWGKRCLDVTTALVLLPPLLLAALLIGLAVRVTSKGPVLYRQERIGVDRRPFTMLKFRTMRVGSDESLHRDYVRRLLAGEVQPEGGLYKLDHDPRTTRVGRLLRRNSLDELPQIFNVLRGQMAIVGPRPVLPWEVELFPRWAHRRFDVRPGLTGLWQVSGRNRLTMTQGLELDVAYVADRTLLLDVKIMVLTIPAVLTGGTR